MMRVRGAEGGVGDAKDPLHTNLHRSSHFNGVMTERKEMRKGRGPLDGAANTFYDESGS